MKIHIDVKPQVNTKNKWWCLHLAFRRRTWRIYIFIWAQKGGPLFFYLSTLHVVDHTIWNTAKEADKDGLRLCMLSGPLVHYFWCNPSWHLDVHASHKWGRDEGLQMSLIVSAWQKVQIKPTAGLHLQSLCTLLPEVTFNSDRLNMLGWDYSLDDCCMDHLRKIKQKKMIKLLE